MIPNSDYQQCIKDCAIKINQNIHIYSGTVLISGATGLIGQVMIDCLLKMNDIGFTDFKIIALAKNSSRAKITLGMYFERDDFQFVSWDVNKPLPELGKIDFCIHAASNTHPRAYSADPIGTIRTNVAGTENLLVYTKEHGGKRFVFLSSVEIYGENRVGSERFKETECGFLDCNQLRAGYPESKRLGESLCCAYAAGYGMDIVIPRLCRVYGPTMGQDDSKALAQFIRKAVLGQNIVLKSAGKQFYSYIHVVDAVTAILWILDKGKIGEAYNVSSLLSDITLNDLAGKLAEIAGTSVVYEPPEEAEKKGYSTATRAVLDNTKLKELGWEETFDMDSGLRMTVNILRELAKGRKGMF